ncbi:MAG: ParA family protein [Nitrospirota bacterium]|nr:ParA family protein [Nitrospirota bacterium]
MHVIVIANQKGGVGKTTVTVNLSAALARLGFPVLVLDLDPQANTSTTLGTRDPYEMKTTATTVFLDKETHVSPWHETNEKDVSLIYGHVSLTRVERDLPRLYITAPGTVLRNKLAAMATGDIEFVLIDCPPSLSMLTANALVAADYLIVPMESGSKYSLDGYSDLEELVRDVKSGGGNPKLDLLGVLCTRHDGRKNLCKAMRTVIENRFGDRVFSTSISASVKIQEAEAAKKTIFAHDRQGTVAREFMELGREVLSRLKLTESTESEDALERESA